MACNGFAAALRGHGPVLGCAIGLKDEMFILRTHIANRRFSPMTDQCARVFRRRGVFLLKCDDPRVTGIHGIDREHESSTDRKPNDFVENVLCFHKTSAPTSLSTWKEAIKLIVAASCMAW